MADIANLQIKVKGNSVNAAKSIDTLKNSLGGLKPETEKTESALGKLARSIGRIAFYRAIRSAVKNLTSSIGDGLKSLYEWDSVLGGTFSQAMDAYASSVQNIKNALGVAFAPAVEALVPLFQRLAHWIMVAANAISRFFAIVSGQSKYRKVIETTTKFADSTSTANGNLKEIKRTLLGFDEINLLNDPNSGSGGRGGGIGSALSEAFTMEDVNFDENKLGDRIAQGIGNIIKTIKENLPAFEMALGGFDLALGAILAFSGANVPLGIGLMALGAIHIAHSASMNWDGLNSNVVGKITELMAAISFALLAIGAVIAFAAPGHVGLGIGMMVAGAAGIAAIGVNWNNIPDQTKATLATIAAIIAPALKFLGVVLMLSSPANIPLGLGLFAAGFASQKFADANWGSLSSKVQEEINKIEGIVMPAMLTIGMLLTVSGLAPVLGIGMIVTAAPYLLSAGERQQRQIQAANGGGISGGMGGGLGNQFQRYYASGGVVPTGEMFVARESGPELVGRIGSQTAVANNDQIVEAVSSGVYRAVSSAMGSRDTTVRVYLDSREIKNGQQRLARANG